eukprot:GHRR01001548.1.p1 GENE.GHRR01001548.1~~GHRR01001548.1.p1  ORF type:complete len:182 (+),score=48.77 GHRR01001548.1:80-625(+)
MGAPAVPAGLVSKQAVSMQTVHSGRVVLTAFSRQRLVCTRAVPQSDKLLKKPELKRPELPPKKLFDESQPQHSATKQTAAPAAPAAATSSTQAAEPSTTGVTIEWQRLRAKEMRQFFIDQKTAEQARKSQLFGWTPTNEIGNGRWAMFGVFVGLLTEYATGVDFPDQIALLLTYLGIVDVE